MLLTLPQVRQPLQMLTTTGSSHLTYGNSCTTTLSLPLSLSNLPLGSIKDAKLIQGHCVVKNKVAQFCVLCLLPVLYQILEFKFSNRRSELL